MKVKDIMSTEIESVCCEDSIEKCAQLMKQHDIGSLPVCDNDRVVGIVTDRDLALRSIAEGQDWKSQKVADVMTKNPSLGSPDMNVKDAAEIMSRQQIRRLPIVENNSLVGIVALGDIALEPALSDKAEDSLRDISKPNHFH
ncbi:CBS domain-containing protein [Anaerocolumna sp. AGMB13020]|uniref:CBS domain-containing protein n=1 Tax=Anaerocolumna sp. AGMB13020 TaxID=3081750 RepID=UPI00295358AF|nr:CBS domain-containing protein [Anaerocolumna sp. AGMB13020]WOO37461.1 CBS domain-containing protein [Anaerocolumna sp. AGMB13020]